MVLFEPMIFKVSVLEGTISVQAGKREGSLGQRREQYRGGPRKHGPLRPVFPTPE